METDGLRVPGVKGPHTIEDVVSVRGKSTPGGADPSRRYKAYVFCSNPFDPG